MICRTKYLGDFFWTFHFPMDVDETVTRQLSAIFPQADGSLIQNCVGEAKRRNAASTSATILTQCIDLILDGQIQNNLNAARVDDDVVYLGTNKTNVGAKDIPEVLLVDDQGLEIKNNLGEGFAMSKHEMSSEDKSTDNSYSEFVREMNAKNTMAQRGETTVPSYSTVLQHVTQILPGVNHDRVKLLYDEGRNLNDIVSYCLEKSYFQSSNSSSYSQASPPETTKYVDYFKEYSSNVSILYRDQSLVLLKNDFRKVYVNNIRSAWKDHHYHYAATRKYLEECLVAMGHSCNSSDSDSQHISPGANAIPTPRSRTPTLRLMAGKRNYISPPGKLDAELEREVEFVKKQKMLKEERVNEIYALHVNEEQYKEEGQLIECGCCFGEFPFENVVQCSDGHLFCLTCLQSYAKEVIFGSSIATVKLVCMTSDCTKQFPYSQLKKCLSKEEVAKYQDRLQEDCLSKVDLGPDLVHCPFCEFAAIVPDDNKVFTCQNSKCMKVTCKECQEEWNDHFGLKCSEVEKKSQTNLRLSYEEKMTIAKVRKCSKCSCQFTKSDGCNKMTCRCSQTMCYICRKPCINYAHFCTHPRDPGHKCTTCSACSLWTDPTEDDELAIKQLKKEVKDAKRKLDEGLELSSTKKKRV